MRSITKSFPFRSSCKCLERLPNGFLKPLCVLRLTSLFGIDQQLGEFGGSRLGIGGRFPGGDGRFPSGKPRFLGRASRFHGMAWGFPGGGGRFQGGKHACPSGARRRRGNNAGFSGGWPSYLGFSYADVLKTRPLLSTTRPALPWLASLVEIIRFA